MGLKYLSKNGERELNDQDQQQQKSRFENKTLSATDQTLKAGVGGDTDKSQANMSKGINEEEH